MTEYRVQLLRDTLVGGKPFSKGSIIRVDLRMLNYMEGCGVIKDAPPESVATPEKEAQKNAKSVAKK